MAYGTAVILGNVAIDLRSVDIDVAVLAELQAGRNARSITSIQVSVGGSALSFARAMLSASSTVPFAVGCVGDDLLGSALVQALTAEGLDHRGIQRSKGDPTGVVSLMYYANGARHLQSPLRRADHALSAAFVEHLMQSEVDAKSVRLAMVSGYLLAASGESCVEAARSVVSWARSRGVPVVVDLVPHAFRSAVGDADTVEALIGPVDALVCEYDTAAELVGLAGSPRNAIEAMTQAGEVLSDGRRTVIVQHRVAHDSYAQVTVTPEADAGVSWFPITRPDLAGFGDRMLVEQLCEMGWLGRAVPRLADGARNGV
jgi:sugar/nucleoside kinase (ribokinase family)